MQVENKKLQERFQKRNQSFMNAGFEKMKKDRIKKEIALRKQARLERFTAIRKVTEAFNELAITHESLSESIQMVFSNSEEANIKGACNIRKILSKEFVPPTQEVVDAGVIPILINFIKRFDYPQLQYEAAWALCNIASGEEKHTLKIIQHGGVPYILDLLESPFDNIKDQGLWVLGNITGDKSSYSEIICKYDGVPRIIKVITESKCDYLLKSATWALGNICKGERAPDFIVIKDAVWVFCDMLQKEDEEILQNALWVLSSITECSEESGNMLIAKGVLSKISSFIYHKEYNIYLPSVLILGHISAGSDDQTSAVVDCGAIEAVVPLLNAPKKEIRKEAAWFLSNISAGDYNHIQKLIDAEVFPKIIRMLSREEREVQFEALWTIVNAVGKGKSEQVNYLVRSGVLLAIVFCLSVSDPKFLQVAFLAIKLILESGEQLSTESGSNPYAVIFEESGGLVSLENLQKHHNFKIYQEASNLVTRFFGGALEDQDLIDMINSP